MKKGDCAYVGEPIPPGQLHQGRIPFYPDPELYSPEVLEGFEKWPQLFVAAMSQRLTYRVVDPRQNDYKISSTLRKNDSLTDLLDLLGEPEFMQEHEYVGLILYHYSIDVEITLRNGYVDSIILLEQGEGEGWDFVLVDQSATKFASKKPPTVLDPFNREVGHEK